MGSLLQGVNLYLIGMMGVGKTTVGPLLAKHLDYGFVDLDSVIAKATDKSINQLFAEVGETEFRQIESDVLSQVCAFTKLTIATGGGIILRRENWGYLHHGLIVWLDVPVELIYSRLAEDTTRPLLQDADLKVKLRSLLEQRTPLYSQADLHITVQEGETPEDIAKRILEEIPNVLKPQVTH
ncbi:MAG: shikimate kinase [Nostoc sp. NMS1]|uniref:shikimate kinase n=1 Tax=unclassified Nostoc TaxID=2593658 RepID=UPI0025F190FF|nr:MULTISPECIES: shikimate kinase [unclassified Nostoc]MBN3909974.1 shikimate kinase [Nostoc sp. NMS1]MBN3991722.1 shikimate kinase [Nostoc sp. NMS2]